MAVGLSSLEITGGLNKNEISGMMRMDSWLKGASKCMLEVWFSVCVGKWLVTGERGVLVELFLKLDYYSAFVY